MVTEEDKAAYKGMNVQARGQWIEAHMEEIVADIRSMSKKDVFLKWPFSQTTLFKIMRLHTPELSVKTRVYRTRKKALAPAVTGNQEAPLTEHDEVIYLRGFKDGVETALKVQKNHD